MYFYPPVFNRSFMSCPLPIDEPARLAALQAYRILDTLPEAAFDRIANLAAQSLRMPLVAISFTDRDRQWVKASVGGFPKEIPRELSFCTHAILEPETLIVPDVQKDPRFVNHPFVVQEGSLRFYAAAVLRTPTRGHALGVLCVADLVPRDLDQPQQQILRDLAALVVDELSLRAEIDARQHAEESLRVQNQTLQALHASVETQVAERTHELIQVNQALHAEVQRRKLAHHERRRSERRFRQLFNQACDAAFVHDVDGRIVDVNDAACTTLGYSREELLRLRISDVEPTHTEENFAFWRQLQVGSTDRFEGRQRRKDGSTLPVEIHVSVLDTGEGRHLLALVRDITERKRAEDLQQRRAREHEVIAHLGTRALSGVGVDALLQEAVEKVAATLEVEICRVLESLPEQDAFLVRTSLPGTPQANGKILRGEEAAFARHVLHTAQAILIHDPATESCFRLPEFVRASGVKKSSICALIGAVPLDARPFGVLVAATTRERTFSEDDMFFVQSVANVLAAAMVRQRHEDDLRLVETRYRRIAANTPGVVYQYLLRADGGVTVPFISESCRTIYGWTPQEIQSDPRRLLDCVHPEDFPGFLAAIHTAKTELSPLHWQGRHLLASGEVRWMRIDSRPERLPDGGVICDGIIIDVTTEKTQRDALHQSEQRFRQAILHSPFPIMLYAEDGEVIQVNHAWTHMTGYLEHELTTMEAWIKRAYASPQEQDRVRRFAAAMTDYVGAVECPGCHVRCASGEERLWDFSCANLGRLADGRWLHIATAIDVTERRKPETAWHTAKAEAERADNAKSEFLSRISHELRTPLNVILGFGQILELGVLDPQGAESTRQILKAGHYLLGLIEAVLDLVRAETGELHLALEQTDASRIVHECAGLVADLGKDRGIVCRVELPPPPLRLWADEQRLRQMLLNLLSNAIKYNRANGEVVVSTETLSSERLRIKVSDTGTGIAPEAVARLFVPFERLGQEHGEVEGAGLGLVVAQRLAEAMDGSLGVESRVGHGSTFWIELPLVPHREAMAASQTHPALASAETAATPGATLLYIEDNVSNLIVVKLLLTKRRPQWHFLSATEGESGLAQARADQPDLILLDLQMPGMPGDEVLRDLRRDPVTRHIPVIMLSADADTHSRERLLSLGADGYILKPYRLDHLLNLLDHALLKTASSAVAPLR